jgi:hypothetical protein
MSLPQLILYALIALISVTLTIQTLASSGPSSIDSAVDRHFGQLTLDTVWAFNLESWPPMSVIVLGGHFHSLH